VSAGVGWTGVGGISLKIGCVANSGGGVERLDSGDGWAESASQS
jgi:hypothetical protein